VQIIRLFFSFVKKCLSKSTHFVYHVLVLEIFIYNIFIFTYTSSGLGCRFGQNSISVVPN